MVLLQDCRQPASALTLCGDQLVIVNSFKSLGSLLASGGCVGEEVSSRIAKGIAAFANPRHLWCCHDIRLSVKERVCNTTVRGAPLYGYETWPIGTEDARRPSFFNLLYLQIIARVWWEHQINIEEVLRRVFHSETRLVNEIIALRCIWWLGHVLHVPAHCLYFRALFARKLGLEVLASVSASCFRSWGPKEEDCCW